MQSTGILNDITVIPIGFGLTMVCVVIGMVIRRLVTGYWTSGLDRYLVRTVKQVRDDRRARKADSRRGFDPSIGRFDVEDATLTERLLGLNDIDTFGNGMNVVPESDPTLSAHPTRQVDETIARIERNNRSGLPTPSFVTAAAPTTAPIESAGDAPVPDAGVGEFVGAFDGRVGGATALQRELDVLAGTFTFEVMWHGEPIQFAISRDGQWIHNVECLAGPHREQVTLAAGSYLLYAVDHDPHYGEFQDVRISVWYTPADTAQAA